MKLLALLLILFFITSCIPLRTAPKIDTDKVKIARKFKKDLPNQYAFVFEDPKEADEFYYFINAKFDLNFDLVESNVPFFVNDKEYALTFYEREKVDKTLNLLPMVLDAALNSDDDDNSIFEDSYSSRVGHWYLILTVSDDQMKDCLSPNYQHRDAVVKYLRTLKEEYLTTNDYKVANLRNKIVKH